MKSTIAAAGLVATGCMPGQLAHQHGTNRPNVLFIICDDLNDSIAGMGGHPQAQTPNINRLMRRGVRFTNAHANALLCGPSRASLITGLYPHTTGYYGYNQNRRAHAADYRIINNAIDIPEYFNLNDYIVYGTGKINHHLNLDHWRGKDLTVRFGHKTDYGPWPWDGKAKYPQAHPNLPAPLNKQMWNGFGPLSNTPVFTVDTEAGPERIKGGWMCFKSVEEYGPYEYHNDNHRDPMPDENSAAWAVEQLAGHDPSQPFFMAVGFCKPHTPFYAPREYFDRFPLKSIQLPPYRDGDLDDCATPLVEKTSPDDWGRDVWDAVQQAGGIEMWKRWVQAYLACVAFVDDQVGKVLDSLEKSSHADNTIVIFTSDHGYHMGEKDHMFKNTLWSEATRVPLVVAGPGIVKNAQCDIAVSLIDLYPTMIDMCNLPPHPNRRSHEQPLDGHSLRPLLTDPQRGRWDGPDAALSVVAGDDELSYHEPGKVERQHFSIKTKRYRYILCNNSQEELYDHQTDPQEWRNLAHDSAYQTVKADLKQTLLEMTGQTSPNIQP